MKRIDTIDKKKLVLARRDLRPLTTVQLTQVVGASGGDGCGGPPHQRER